RWHRSLPWIAKGATLNRPAEALVAVKNPRAALFRSGGRHHLVLVGGFARTQHDCSVELALEAV
ncbi:MAG: hypothetical protein WCB94_03640, partial [Terriglobales bacterium]